MNRLPCFLVSYLTAIFISGTILVFQVTPMTGIDESYHYKRALQISEGQLLAKHLGPNQWGGALNRREVEFSCWFDADRNAGRPTSRSNAVAAEASVSALPPGRETHWFPSTASYPPLPYLPAALGLATARALHVPLLGRIESGRLFNLGLYVLALALIATLLSTSALAALAILSTPTMVHLATTYSADPFTNTVAIIFVALCIRAMGRDGRISRREALAIAAVALSLGLLKITCFVVSLSVLIIPARRFATIRAAWIFRGIVIGASTFVALAWNGMFPFVPGYLWHPGANPHAMTSMVIHRPGHALSMCWASLRSGMEWWWEEAFSRFGGGPEPYFFKIGGAFPELGGALVFYLFLADRGSTRNVRAGLVLAGTGLLYAFLVLIAFMIGYNAPADDVIMGLQGRYFVIPLIIMMLGVSLCLPRPRLPTWVSRILLFGYLAVTLSVSVLALERYAPLWN